MLSPNKIRVKGVWRKTCQMTPCTPQNPHGRLEVEFRTLVSEAFNFAPELWQNSNTRVCRGIPMPDLSASFFKNPCVELSLLETTNLAVRRRRIRSIDCANVTFSLNGNLMRVWTRWRGTLITSGDHTGLGTFSDNHHWIGITSSADRIAAGAEVTSVVIYFEFLSKLSTSKFINSKSLRHPRIRMTPVLTPSRTPSAFSLLYLFSLTYIWPLGCCASTQINNFELLLLSLFVFIMAFVRGIFDIATRCELDGPGV
jgi:hypothetical protein